MSGLGDIERIASMRNTYILLASDDALVIEGVTLAIKGLKNISLQHCATFRAALPRIRIERYDCIIVDKNLGGGDGIALAPIIKRINPECLSILLVPHYQWATTEAARTLGYSSAISADEVAGTLGVVLADLLDTTSTAITDSSKTARQRIDRLSEREREILVDISQGKRNYEIASLRHISEGTIKSHLSSIYRKLEVRNRVEAISMMNGY